jgi:hypothetical protein
MSQTCECPYHDDECGNEGTVETKYGLVCRSCYADLTRAMERVKQHENEIIVIDNDMAALLDWA